MRTLEASPADTVEPVLCLEDGADQASCGFLEVHDNGLVFESQWQFEEMSQLTVRLSWIGTNENRQRLAIEGTVVDSKPYDLNVYRTTILFIDDADAALGEWLQNAKSVRNSLRGFIEKPR